MFRRIGLCILAASIAFGAVIIEEQPNATTAVAEPTPNPATGYVPKISQAERDNAPLAPVYTNCKKPGQIVITFDDGPNPKKGTTDAALDFLREKNIKATFFINANNWGHLEEEPESVELVKRIYKEGHDIGSHTYNHVDLFKALDEGIMEENIDKMTDKIQEMIGVKPAFFRPPNGSGGYPDYGHADRAQKNEIIQKYLGASGYSIIMWGADTRDWEKKGDVDYSISVLDKDLKAEGVSPATHSFITLMHDVHATTVSGVLPRVVEHVTELGYTIVPLTECLGLQSAYQPDPTNDVDSLLINNSTTPSNPKEIETESDSSATQVKMIYSLVAVILSFFILF